MSSSLPVAFAPSLIIGKGITDISFYEKAFGAEELRRWRNDDGSIHVAELSIGGAKFHLHEENVKAGTFSPQTAKGVTSRAIEAGAKVISPAKSYDYGYRQGDILDIFGHHWMIQMVI
jgi:PhnB protein